MKLFSFDPEHTISEFGSHEATIAGVARCSGRAQVVCIRLEPGGVLGEHEARGAQVFLVVEGEGWTRSNGDRFELARGQGAFWEDGERHETGTDEGLTAIVVEAEAIELI